MLRAASVCDGKGFHFHKMFLEIRHVPLPRSRNLLVRLAHYKTVTTHAAMDLEDPPAETGPAGRGGKSIHTLFEVHVRMLVLYNALGKVTLMIQLLYCKKVRILKCSKVVRKIIFAIFCRE